MTFVLSLSEGISMRSSIVWKHLFCFSHIFVLTLFFNGRNFCASVDVLWPLFRFYNKHLRFDMFCLYVKTFWYDHRCFVVVFVLFWAFLLWFFEGVFWHFYVKEFLYFFAWRNSYTLFTWRNYCSILRTGILYIFTRRNFYTFFFSSRNF